MAVVPGLRWLEFWLAGVSAGLVINLQVGLGGLAGWVGSIGIPAPQLHGCGPHPPTHPSPPLGSPFSPLFLCLQSADTVVLYDPDFNPFVDAQASVAGDRKERERSCGDWK